MLTGELSTPVRMSGEIYRSTGVSDYNDLENKPTYNGHIIEGDLTSENLGIWQPKNFSTNEQNTGVKWIDGKDIYRTIIEFNTMYNNMSIPFNVNIDNIIKLNGIVNYIDEQYINIPYYNTNSYYIRVYYRKSTHDILFETTNEQSQYYNKGFIIIEYTKN